MLTKKELSKTPTLCFSFVFLLSSVRERQMVQHVRVPTVKCRDTASTGIAYRSSLQESVFGAFSLRASCFDSGRNGFLNNSSTESSNITRFKLSELSEYLHLPFRKIN